MRIDSEILRERICRVINSTQDEDMKHAYYSVLDIIDNMPAAEAIPISWLNWQIQFAEKENLFEPAAALRHTKDLWERTIDYWDELKE